jgi:HEPN domain-containing protein
MPTPKAVLTVIREWLAKADNDLKNAAHTLTLGPDCPTDTVCFHAHQCVEKHLKALLVAHATAFPKTHDIGALLALVPAGRRPKLDKGLRDRLTAYATVLRYPGAGPDVALTEARKAVAVARRIRKEVRRQLPAAALRRGGK